MKAVTTGTRVFDHTKIQPKRKERGWSQLALAKLSGIPLDTLRLYEQGRAVPSVARLFMIADTLGCSLDDLSTCTGGSDTTES